MDKKNFVIKYYYNFDRKPKINDSRNNSEGFKKYDDNKGNNILKQIQIILLEIMTLNIILIKGKKNLIHFIA